MRDRKCRRQLYKSLVFQAADMLLINTFFRKIIEDRLLVVCYHGVRTDNITPSEQQSLHVPKSVFEQQIKFLGKRYDPISEEVLYQSVSSGRPLPRKALLITFDDGYLNVFDNALPLLRELDIPAIIFVNPGVVSTGEWLWPQKFFYYKQFMNKNTELDALIQSPGNTFEKNSVLLHLLNTYGPCPTNGNNQLADWQILKTAPIYGAQIGSHSQTHPVLPKCTDIELDFELISSRETIKNNLGEFPRSLAYPFGFMDSRTVSATKSAGYSLAFTTMGCHSRKLINPFAIPRFMIGAEDTPVTLSARLSGWLEYLRLIFRKL